MIRGCHYTINVIVGALHIEGAGNHLWAFISDAALRIAETGDDFNLNETRYISCYMFSDGPSHGPLCGIVDGGNEETFAKIGFVNGTYIIKGPLF